MWCRRTERAAQVWDRQGRVGGGGRVEEEDGKGREGCGGGRRVESGGGG